MSVFGGTPRQLILNVDSAVSFAPDGNRFTYVRWLPDQKDNFSEIHIADKDGGNDQVLYPTVEEAQAPVWSPDGKRIAWLQTEAGTTRMGLKVMELSSKKITTVAPVSRNFFCEPRSRLHDARLDARQPPSAGALLQAAHQPYADRRRHSTIR